MTATAPSATGGTNAPARAATWTVTAYTPADDAPLRALLRATVIPGAVRVAFTREPSYLAGEGVAGGVDHAVVARHDGRLVGVGRCTVLSLNRNGAAQRVGYLGELRIAPGTPGSVRMLRDGYAALSEALQGDGVEAFFTSITSDNERARRVLEGGRRLGLPAYTPLASLVTLVAPTGRRSPRAPDVTGERAVDAGALLDFLQRASRATHLTLAWDAERLASLGAHGVSPADFVVIRRGGAIVAAGSAWDQRPFRQVVIDGYGGALRLARQGVNVALRLRTLPPLPPPGSVLAQGALLGATVAEPGDWRLLWPALQAQARARGLDWVTISRDARDPELDVLRALLRAREYHTTLYDVALDGRTPRTPWDGRLVRPEVGLL